MENKKAYYSFSDYVKNKFGVKVGKISIDTDFEKKILTVNGLME